MLFSFGLTGIGLYSEITRNLAGPPPVNGLKRFLAYMDEPILSSIRQCARNAEGAATNTSDLRGCLAAARTAGTHGRDAENQLNDLKNQIQSLIPKSE
jgi:hypothetical protein